MSDDEEECFNTNIPIYSQKEDREQHKSQNKQVLLNLGIFALLIAISSLIFMIFLAKKTREDDTQHNILPFHNPLDRQQLLCPLNTSFDTSRFSCVECPDNCEYCYHEYTQRCVQCVHPYKLFENECVEDCISVDNVCINTTELDQLNYTIVDLGTELRVNQLFQVEIHTYSSANIMIIFPPMGQSFNYFYDSLKLPEMAKTLNGTIFVFSTPYTEVLQIQKVPEDGDDTQSEEFRFIERIGNFTKTYFTQETKSIKIVGLGDMLFFAHELATMIVKQNACSEGEISVILLQTKQIQLLEFLNLSDIRLQHLLAYIDSEWDISHKENTTNLIASDKPDLSTQLRDFRLALNFNKQIRPSYNKKIDVIVISEKGARDIQSLYSDGFNAKSFKQIQLDTDKWSVLFGKAL